MQTDMERLQMDGTGAGLLESTVRTLKSAGYTWSQEPTASQPGAGLLLPGGSPFPPVTLLAPPAEYDAGRASAAAHIEQQVRQLGISLVAQLTDPQSLRYAVYSSGQYDMAILGWRLSEYPGYLCDWFRAPSPFAYQDDKLQRACEAMNSTADLGTARSTAYEIEAILMEDLPFIPLYLEPRFDAYHGVAYPFESNLGGLSSLYGAPDLAIPNP
jgi:ABC-type transport system substrate-binding protein